MLLLNEKNVPIYFNFDFEWNLGYFLLPCMPVFKLVVSKYMPMIKVNKISLKGSYIHSRLSDEWSAAQTTETTPEAGEGFDLSSSSSGSVHWWLYSVAGAATLAISWSGLECWETSIHTVHTLQWKLVTVSRQHSSYWRLRGKYDHQMLLPSSLPWRCLRLAIVHNIHSIFFLFGSIISNKNTYT